MRKDPKMKTTILACLAFVASLAVGVAAAPTPAAAAPAQACPYCHGDRCGRGTLGSYFCSMDQWGCHESGTCDHT